MIKGADISFLPEIEDFGTKFYDASGKEGNALDILKASGVNTIRVRLWHTPATERSSLEEVKEFAARIKAKGFRLWLTVHYSDTWADPGQQTKPAAWDELSFELLSDSVYKYTKKITTLLQPDIIQLGNEINGGFLWPDGGNDPDHLANFITLLKRGSTAVRETSATTSIMVHVAGFDVAPWFYQQLETNEVDYDLIGLSYYPIWHGKAVPNAQKKMEELGAKFQKSIVIAETAYPFTLTWDDNTNNILGLEDQLASGFPATPQGQKDFLLKIKSIASGNDYVVGFCYWGAEWVAYKGPGSTTGSTWENQALFDFNNKAVPALDAFND